MAARGRMKLKVHLDDNGRISEIFVSPTTKCRDIVQRLQRQIRQTNCCLVEVWQGCERLVPEDELIQSTLLEWDTDLEEVAFYLRPYEEILSPHLMVPVTDGIQIIEEDVPQISGSTLMVARNGLHENHGISRYNMSERYSLEDLQQLAVRQQQEIEMKERLLAEKEQQLKEIKQRTRHKIRSTYIDQLETQIHEQDMKMRELRQIQDEIEAYRLNNSVLDEELQSMETLFTIKEQELAIAAAKVEGLTKQLNEQREKWKNASNQNERNKEEIEVDRLRQELMTRNELNHQQSVQMQAQKQLLAEKHKELFELDSQIDQLTQELHKKRAGNVHSTPNTNHRNGTANQDVSDMENGLWENGESFDWSEFANTKDTYDEEVRLNYNDSDMSISGHRSRQNNSRPLETLVEEEEPLSPGTSKTSSIDGSSNSQGVPLSPKQGRKSRVSRLATFFEAEVAAQNESKDRKGAKKDAFNESSYESRGSTLEMGPKHVETMNTRGHEMINNSSMKLQTSLGRESEKATDNIFYHRPFGSSPLSSPSSLSSLSSFSSTSSTSRTIGRHDELRINPENALRSRESKTTGLETSSVSTSYEKPRESYYESEGYSELSNSVEGSPSSTQDFSRDKTTTGNSNSPFGNVKTSLQQLRSMAISLSESGRTTSRRGLGVSQSPHETNSQGHASQQEVPHDEEVHTRSQQTVNFMVKPTGTSFVPQKTNTTEVPTRKTSSPSVAMVFASSPVRDILSSDGEDGRTESNQNQTKRHSYGSQERKFPVAPIRKALSSEEISSKKNDNTDPVFSTSSSQAVTKVRITLTSSGIHPTPTTPEISDHTRGENVEFTDINILKGDGKSQDRMRTARVIAIDPKEPFTVEKGSPGSSRSADPGSSVMTTTSSQLRATPTNKQNVHSTSLTEEKKYGDTDKGKVSSPGPQETPTSGERKRVRHVILDPHAVLLDAAVEGELEQVKRVIRDVDDPSLANNDGITALHNAVCGNHDSVVKFLVEYGCDVNLPDSHGWTPLHCSAANNNISVIKYLVEHGACIFATTGLQKKTPVQCCEKSLPGYKECVDYLRDIQDNFGMTFDGKVYALFAYNANEKDELSFECGEELYVLRRGDSNEKEWWWAKNSSGQLGYIPRNLLGISPRVAPEV
ncbi:apoptosis-stimulating of p53 protein 1-like isoform X2 [Actinia tenebrosa]|uniref:Apoptosis-stimulating of p53 protein 1-like isoform X2 n=1 Tax=Actinia tenebrosa TaxID=6105 RepID=A0A6P8IN54_ACTTE|nr:apoptosis-stimulating of p53 protein 1-like isoform X2 [Actinia tenebrosa]